MRKASLIVLLLAGLVAAAFGQNLVVSYADGTVEMLPKGQKTWKALDIGAEVPRDAQVRVQASGTLELTLGKLRISIIKDGTYAVADLVKASGSSTGTGLGASLAQKLHGLTTEREKTGTAGGVRGAAQGSVELVWVDESTEVVSQVKDLFAKGKYKEAVSALNDAIEAAGSDEEKDEFRFLLASAYAGNGENARAWKIVSSLKVDRTTSWFPELLVLKGQLQTDAMQYADALATLKPLLEPLSNDEFGQAACLVAYFSYKGLGQSAAAEDMLKRGVAIDPQSDTGKQLSALQGKTS